MDGEVRARRTPGLAIDPLRVETAVAVQLQPRTPTFRRATIRHPGPRSVGRGRSILPALEGFRPERREKESFVAIEEDPTLVRGDEDTSAGRVREDAFDG